MMNIEIVSEYTLKSKDTALIDFTLCSQKNYVKGIVDISYSLEITKVYEENYKLFPKALKENFNKNDLLKWIERRKAPKNRRFVEKILASIDDTDNPLKYVDVSKALSLNDAHWIENVNDKKAWKDINLYNHPFAEILANVAFTGYSHKVPGVLTSPELTSTGAMKKCWSNRADGIFLIKGDDFVIWNSVTQATLEFYASQIAEIMEFEHLDYDIEEFHHQNAEKELVSTCKLFTSEDEGFVDAKTFFECNGFNFEKVNLQALDTQLKMAEVYGQDKYADLMVFDAVICNRDRHLGNFGYIIDNNTGDFLRSAPIFDNGYSFSYRAAKSDYDDLKNYEESIKHGKYLNFDKQAQLFIEPRHIPKLRKLLAFKFKRHPKYNIEEKYLMFMEAMIHSRAKKLLEIYKQVRKNA